MRIEPLRPYSLVFLTYALLLWQPQSQAQQKPAMLPATKVIANHLNEDLQTTTQTVSVFSGETLRERNVRRMDDLLRLIPNASVANAEYGAAVSDWNYRGLNPSLFEKTSPILVYVDGIAQSDRFSLNIDMDDIERVEIHRGPAGTMFGTNAMGGVIFITTRSAQGKTPSGNVRATVGNHGQRNAGATLFLPLAGIVDLKLNASQRQDDGVLRRTFPGPGNEDRQRERFLSGSANVALGQNGLLTYAFNLDERRHGFGRLQVVDRADLNNRHAPGSIDMDLPNRQRGRANRHLLSARYDFGPGSLEAQITRSNQHITGQFDCDYSAMPLYSCGTDRETRRDSAELRWVVDQGKLPWVIGITQQRETQLWGDNSMNIVTPPLTMLQTQGKLRERVWAGFGQLSAELSPQWRATVGGRWQRVERTVDVGISTLDNTMRPYTLPLKGQRTRGVFLPKAGVSWTPVEGQTWFAGLSTGYGAGGFNAIYPVTNATQAEYQPQRSRQLELGYKARLGEQWQIQITAFHTRVDNIQAQERLPTGYQAVNLKGSNNRGLEAELLWHPAPGWQVDASGGWLQARYRSGTTYLPTGAAARVDVGGRKVEFAPTATALVGLQTQQGPWFGRVEARYLGARTLGPLGDASLKPSTTYNLRAGYRNKTSSTSGWEIAAYVRNLTNRTVVLGAYAPSPDSQPNSFVRTLDAPRSIGIETTVRF